MVQVFVNENPKRSIGADISIDQSKMNREVLNEFDGAGENVPFENRVKNGSPHFQDDRRAKITISLAFGLQ